MSEEELIVYKVTKEGGANVGGVQRDKGDLVTLDSNSETTQLMVQNDIIEPQPEKDTAAITDDDDKVGEDEEKTKSSKGSKLKSWASASNWLSAEDVEKGDIITILSEHEMQEYEGNESPVVKVEHDGVQANLRLNKQNTENIADEYGWDSNNWVGEQIKVVSIKKYPGVNAKGMILEPLRE